MVWILAHGMRIVKLSPTLKRRRSERVMTTKTMFKGRRWSTGDRQLSRTYWT